MQLPHFFQLISHRSLSPIWESECAFSIHKWVVLPPEVWTGERGWDEVVHARRRRMPGIRVSHGIGEQLVSAGWGALSAGTAEYELFASAVASASSFLTSMMQVYPGSQTAPHLLLRPVSKAEGLQQHSEMFTPSCQNCASKMRAKTPVRGHDFSLHHVAPLLDLLACNPRLCFITMDWGQATAQISAHSRWERTEGGRRDFSPTYSFLNIGSHFPRVIKVKRKQQTRQRKNEQAFSWFAMQLVFSCIPIHACFGRQLLSEKWKPKARAELDLTASASIG